MENQEIRLKLEMRICDFKNDAHFHHWWKGFRPHNSVSKSVQHIFVYTFIVKANCFDVKILP